MNIVMKKKKHQGLWDYKHLNVKRIFSFVLKGILQNKQALHQTNCPSLLNADLN